jgi:signal transduction histidine kinase
MGDVLRRLRRIALGGLVATIAIFLVGVILERVRFGPSDPTALARVAAEVQHQFASLGAGLEDAARAVTPERRGTGPDADATRARRWFDQAATLFESHAGTLDAISIYDGSGQPVAWAGRPSSLPLDRLAGPAATFVTPGALGLRLVHVRPLLDSGESPRRIGAVAAEVLLTRQALLPTDGSAASRFVFPTSLAPVALRPRYEGAGESLPPYGFVLTTESGAPLLEAEVAPGALRALRQDFRARVRAVVWGLLALTLAVLALAVRDAQAREVGRARAFTLTAVIVALLVATRALVGLAVPSAWRFAEATGRLDRTLFGSPADLALTALVALACVALLGDLVERCRFARRGTARAPRTTALDHLRFWSVQAVAGGLAGVVLVAEVHLLALVVRVSGASGVSFALHPFETGRLTVLVGLLAASASALWAMIVVLRAAATWWRVPEDALTRRIGLAGVYTSAMLGVVMVCGDRVPLSHPGPLLPAVVVVLAATALARWGMPRYRHASQGLRLVTAYLALCVPSLALYPVVVSLEQADLERTLAGQYAPEALNHRSELRVQLRRSLDQLDRVSGNVDQFVPVPGASDDVPDADRAFFLWSLTELGRRRLTSSLELYAADGTLVSRFALNLPAEYLATERPVDASCTWAVFGEALASTDDQVLLHAGRAVCEHAADGSVRRIGTILVHVVLDYGTLPFVAAQEPAAALFRPPQSSTPPTHGREISFAVYGWGRTPVYPTAGTAWPISRDLLARLYRAGRQPFWEDLSRGERRYRVLLNNDRAGIYAIGYEVLRPVDHAVALAEIVTMAGVTFVGILLVLGGLNRLAGSRPHTGRALLREIRTSFYRKLFLLFVGASVVPVLALALLTRAYIETQLREGLEQSALRTASAARRVIETVVSQQRRDRPDPTAAVTDEIMVSVSRIIDQDVNVFAGPSLVATSQRDLFASGLLPTRTPAEVARAIGLERQSSYIGDERLGQLQYTLAAVPVRDGEAGSILTVPLVLRQQEIEREIDALDRRVTLFAVLFILLGAVVGYVTAERIGDPIQRLTRATRRIARGDLDARILAAPADELGRLVDAFNQMAADLQRQRAELEHTNRLAAWADMARQVAHDIKNPLTPIQLSAEHLRRVHRDSRSPLGDVVDNCVNTILSQVSMLRQIASEFSSFASSPVARPATVRLDEVVTEVLAPYRTGLPDTVHLVVEAGEGLPELWVDRGLIGRALVNVVENALHAMRGGGTLTIRTAALDQAALLEVADTGVGMDADATSRLFEPYFSTKATGTGLGLTIAKRNVELNGGTIEVRSEKGRGTVVRLTLPAAAVSGAGAPPASR